MTSCPLQLERRALTQKVRRFQSTEGGKGKEEEPGALAGALCSSLWGRNF